MLLGHNDSSTINILKEAAENLSNSMNDLLMLQRIEEGTNQHFARVYIITLYMRTYHALYIYILDCILGTIKLDAKPFSIEDLLSNLSLKVEEYRYHII